MTIDGPPKRIQEISAEGEEPPPEFFVKDTILAGNLGSVPSIEIPVIDLNLLSLDPTSEAYKDEINKLLSALTSWGVFQVVLENYFESRKSVARGVPYVLVKNARTGVGVCRFNKSC
ncbi:hypothetical protein HAX54_000284 [Datura stramonium]|uniref:Uncharacterized protein n=1 Tax=Datura stramonium TaxID=4076 RepID=A0ABS8WSS5_DATST|nr:hypothetical protein [Datura stramonium]